MDIILPTESIENSNINEDNEDIKFTCKYNIINMHHLIESHK